MNASDPHDLQRFVDAQEGLIDIALDELRGGSKRSHWMWFVFPQIAGLGRSPMARLYAIASLEEASAYLEHPLLGPRLRLCIEALEGWADSRSADRIFGTIDALKLHSSLTLFDRAQPGGAFGKALLNFFGGQRDQATLALLRGRE